MSACAYDTVVLLMEELDKARPYGDLELELGYGGAGVTRETFNVLYDARLPTYLDGPEPEDNITLVFGLAREYYESRGFSVEQLALEEMTDTISPEMDAVVSAQLSRDGAASEEKLELQRRGGIWEVAAEGN